MQRVLFVSDGRSGLGLLARSMARDIAGERYIINCAVTDAGEGWVVPMTSWDAPTGLIADQTISKTRFHLGFQVRGGLRANVGPEDNPIGMRLTATWNVWSEHDRPISFVGGALSFGR